MFEFSTEQFSGPLGLLLALIEKEELDIAEVSLAKIANEYVAYIQESNNIKAKEMADFLLIAAKLLFIKSKILLPYLYQDEEGEEIDDLKKQLKMYQEFVLASQKVKNIIEKGNWLYIPPLNNVRQSRRQFNLAFFSPPAKLTPELLAEKFNLFLSKLKQREAEPLVEKKLEIKINIEDKIVSIKELLAHKIKVNFTNFIKTASSKTEIIVSFLAILELVKQKELFLEQDKLFSEIQISRLD